MKSEEAPGLVHELAVETRKLLDKTEREGQLTAQAIEEVSTEDRELIREQLTWLAKYIREKYKFSVPTIRRVLREMLGVTV